MSCWGGGALTSFTPITSSSVTDVVQTVTVDSEMFARTLFSLIFANSLSREFKVLANINK